MSAAIHPEPANATWDIHELARTREGRSTLERHLAQVVEGAAFRGSRRSAQFLEYIVQQAAEGKGDRLKERTIGIELFGRTPSYDTGEDAIVRVTASDVRKRLVQHYGREEDQMEFRLCLRPGTYVPELVRNVPKLNLAPVQTQPIGESDVGVSDEIAAADGAAHGAIAPVAVETSKDETSASASTLRRWVYLAVSLVLLLCGVAVWFAFVDAGRTPAHGAAAPATAPWSALFDGTHPLLVVASDPNIAEIQSLTHHTISLSDYANQRWIPIDTSHIPPLQVQFMQQVLIGNKISDYDGQIIAELGNLIPARQRSIHVHAARAVRIQQLESNENLVLLGSERSNPWSSLFDSMLDFQYVHDEQLHGEYIRNKHPASGELTKYVPSANGYGTGESFATVSLFRNPGHTGYVLMIGGADGEGTQAAGELVADPSRWGDVDKACHLTVAGVPHASLQLLLRLSTMAGSPRDVHIVACHLLSGE